MSIRYRLLEAPKKRTLVTKEENVLKHCHIEVTLQELRERFIQTLKTLSMIIQS